MNDKLNDGLYEQVMGLRRDIKAQLKIVNAILSRLDKSNCSPTKRLNDGQQETKNSATRARREYIASMMKETEPRTQGKILREISREVIGRSCCDDRLCNWLFKPQKVKCLTHLQPLPKPDEFRRHLRGNSLPSWIQIEGNAKVF